MIQLGGNDRRPLTEIGSMVGDVFVDENNENDSGLWMTGNLVGEGIGDFEGGGVVVFDDRPFY